MPVSRPVPQVVPQVDGAASTLVGDALPSAPRWREAARTAVSVHYETGVAAVPVVCLTTPAGVRLPHSLLVDALPTGAFRARVTRWWVPPRPGPLRPPSVGDLALLPACAHDELDPPALVGRGVGLTPAGDDVLAGALVAGRATGHPALPGWRAATVRALATRRTTAVSVGMLHSALGGWAAPELAAAVEALCSDARAADEAVARLLAVGHSSGRHLLDGVLHALRTHPDAGRAERGAA